MSERHRAGAGEEWPRPLPVLLAPARDEALSSWVVRHAAFYGLSRTAMRRYCAPDIPSLRLIDRTLTPEQEARLAHLFRLGRPALRRMTQAELHPDAIGCLVAYDVDHRCEHCARSLAEAGFSGAVRRAWFHTWRITCARCGSRMLPARTATGADGGTALDLFPHLWAKALQGEHLLNVAVHRTTTSAALIPPLRLLRLLMIWTGNEKAPGNEERQCGGWTLDAVVPGFDAALERHGIAIPRTTLINVPLPVRTALLAGLTLAVQDPAATIKAMWATTSGMHRAHFRYVLTDIPGGDRFRSMLADIPPGISLLSGLQQT